MREAGDIALDLARRHLPDVPEKELGWLLWNETAYPCCSEEHLVRQLRALHKKLKAAGLPDAV